MAAIVAVPFKPIEHNETRTFQSYPGAQYCLPSDDPEKDRLALQHGILKKAFENRVILAPVTFLAGDKVLDSATGSGTFILDAMAQVPSTVALCGIDIESRLFPSSNEQVVARGNVEFTTASITQLPLGWSNRYRFVHQRLLVAALQLHEWKQAISEMYRVITPGGWLQLGEVGPWQAGPITVEHIALLLALFKSRGLVLDIYKHIPEMMREAGFIDVYEEERSLPLGRSAGQYGMDVRDNFMGVFRGMKIPTLKAGGFGFVSTEEEYDALMKSVEQEWDETSGAHFKFFIICGRKPF